MKVVECTVRYNTKFDLSKSQVCYLNKYKLDIVMYNPIWDNVIILKSDNPNKVGERTNYKREELTVISGDRLSITYEL